MKKVFVTFIVALFATVVFGQDKTEISSKDLPDCVEKYVHTNMPGFIIDKAYRIDLDGVFTYEVSLIKGKERHILTFDETCKVLKKETPKGNPDEKKKPPTKPKTRPQTGTEKTEPKK